MVVIGSRKRGPGVCARQWRGTRGAATDDRLRRLHFGAGRAEPLPL